MKIEQLEDIKDLPGFLYIATPYSRYSAGLTSAAHDAAFGAARLMERGYRVFSPIAHSHAIAMAGDLDPLDAQLWMDMDEPFVALASALIVIELDGWHDSIGVSAEIDAFRLAGKPIVYIKPGEL